YHHGRFFSVHVVKGDSMEEARRGGNRHSSLGSWRLPLSLFAGNLSMLIARDGFFLSSCRCEIAAVARPDAAFVPVSHFSGSVSVPLSHGNSDSVLSLAALCLPTAQVFVIGSSSFASHRPAEFSISTAWWCVLCSRVQCARMVPDRLRESPGDGSLDFNFEAPESASCLAKLHSGRCTFFFSSFQRFVRYDVFLSTSSYVAGSDFQILDGDSTCTTSRCSAPDSRRQIVHAAPNRAMDGFEIPRGVTDRRISPRALSPAMSFVRMLQGLISDSRWRFHVYDEPLLSAPDSRRQIVHAAPNRAMDGFEIPRVVTDRRISPRALSPAMSCEIAAVARPDAAFVPVSHFSGSVSVPLSHGNSDSVLSLAALPTYGAGFALAVFVIGSSSFASHRPAEFSISTAWCMLQGLISDSRWRFHVHDEPLLSARLPPPDCPCCAEPCNGRVRNSPCGDGSQNITTGAFSGHVVKGDSMEEARRGGNRHSSLGSVAFTSVTLCWCEIAAVARPDAAFVPVSHFSGSVSVPLSHGNSDSVLSLAAPPTYGAGFALAVFVIGSSSFASHRPAEFSISTAWCDFRSVRRCSVREWFRTGYLYESGRHRIGASQASFCMLQGLISDSRWRFHVYDEPLLSARLPPPDCPCCAEPCNGRVRNSPCGDGSQNITTGAFSGHVVKGDSMEEARRGGNRHSSLGSVAFTSVTLCWCEIAAVARPDAAFVPVSHFSGSVSVPLSHGNSDSVLSLAAPPTYGAGFALAVFVIGSSSFASHRPSKFSISTAWCMLQGLISDSRWRFHVYDEPLLSARLPPPDCPCCAEPCNGRVRNSPCGDGSQNITTGAFSGHVVKGDSMEEARRGGNRHSSLGSVAFTSVTLCWCEIAAVARPDAAFVPVSHFSGSVSVPLSHGNSDSVLSLAALPTYGAGFALAVFVIGSSSFASHRPAEFSISTAWCMLQGLISDSRWRFHVYDEPLLSARLPPPDCPCCAEPCNGRVRNSPCGDGSQNITTGAFSGHVVKGDSMEEARRGGNRHSSLGSVAFTSVTLCWCEIAAVARPDAAFVPVSHFSGSVSVPLSHGNSDSVLSLAALPTYGAGFALAVFVIGSSSFASHRPAEFSISTAWCMLQGLISDSRWRFHVYDEPLLSARLPPPDCPCCAEPCNGRVRNSPCGDGSQNITTGAFSGHVVKGDSMEEARRGGNRHSSLGSVAFTSVTLCWCEIAAVARPDAAFVPVSHFSGSVSVPLSHGNSDSVLSLAALPTYGAGFALAVFVIGSSSFASHRPAEFSISTAWCCTKVEDIGSVHRRLHSGSDFRFSMAIPRVRRAAAQRPTPAARLSMLRRTVQWTGSKLTVWCEIAAVARPDAAFVPVSHFSGSVSVPLSHGNSDSVLSLAALPTYRAGFALAVFVIGSSSFASHRPAEFSISTAWCMLQGLISDSRWRFHVYDEPLLSARLPPPDCPCCAEPCNGRVRNSPCGDGSQNITTGAFSGHVVKGDSMEEARRGGNRHSSLGSVAFTSVTLCWCEIAAVARPDAAFVPVSHFSGSVSVPLSHGNSDSVLSLAALPTYGAGFALAVFVIGSSSFASHRPAEFSISTAWCMLQGLISDSRWRFHVYDEPLLSARLPPPDCPCCAEPCNGRVRNSPCGDGSQNITTGAFSGHVVKGDSMEEARRGGNRHSSLGSVAFTSVTLCWCEIAAVARPDAAFVPVSHFSGSVSVPLSHGNSDSVLSLAAPPTYGAGFALAVFVIGSSSFASHRPAEFSISTAWCMLQGLISDSRWRFHVYDEPLLSARLPPPDCPCCAEPCNGRVRNSPCGDGSQNITTGAFSGHVVKGDSMEEARRGGNRHSSLGSVAFTSVTLCCCRCEIAAVARPDAAFVPVSHFSGSVSVPLSHGNSDSVLSLAALPTYGAGFALAVFVIGSSSFASHRPAEFSISTAWCMLQGLISDSRWRFHVYDEPLLSARLPPPDCPCCAEPCNGRVRNSPCGDGSQNITTGAFSGLVVKGDSMEEARRGGNRHSSLGSVAFTSVTLCWCEIAAVARPDAAFVPVSHFSGSVSVPLSHGNSDSVLSLAALPTYGAGFALAVFVIGSSSFASHRPAEFSISTAWCMLQGLISDSRWRFHVYDEPLLSARLPPPDCPCCAEPCNGRVRNSPCGDGSQNITTGAFSGHVVKGDSMEEARRGGNRHSSLGSVAFTSVTLCWCEIAAVARPDAAFVPVSHFSGSVSVPLSHGNSDSVLSLAALPTYGAGLALAVFVIGSSSFASHRPAEFSISTAWWCVLCSRVAVVSALSVFFFLYIRHFKVIFGQCVGAVCANGSRIGHLYESGRHRIGASQASFCMLQGLISDSRWRFHVYDEPLLSARLPPPDCPCCAEPCNGRVRNSPCGDGSQNITTGAFSGHVVKGDSMEEARRGGNRHSSLGSVAFTSVTLCWCEIAAVARPDAAFVPVSHFSGSVSVPLSHGNSDSVLSLAALPTYGAGFALAVFVIGSSSFASHRPAEFSISTAWCMLQGLISDSRWRFHVYDEPLLSARLPPPDCPCCAEPCNGRVRNSPCGDGSQNITTGAFSGHVVKGDSMEEARRGGNRHSSLGSVAFTSVTLCWCEIAAVARPDAAFVPVSHFSGSVSVPLSHGNSDSVLSLAALPTYGAGFALAVFVIGSSSFASHRPAEFSISTAWCMLQGLISDSRWRFHVYDEPLLSARLPPPDCPCCAEPCNGRVRNSPCGDGSQNITTGAFSGHVVKGDSMEEARRGGNRHSSLGSVAFTSVTLCWCEIAAVARPDAAFVPVSHFSGSVSVPLSHGNSDSVLSLAALPTYGAGFALAVFVIGSSSFASHRPAEFSISTAWCMLQGLISDSRWRFHVYDEPLLSARLPPPDCPCCAEPCNGRVRNSPCGDGSQNITTGAFSGHVVKGDSMEEARRGGNRHSSLGSVAFTSVTLCW
ncbi:hypothetical protein U1Q18_051650, partial [Sarracenia purpurea var. burkii]